MFYIQMYIVRKAIIYMCEDKYKNIGILGSRLFSHRGRIEYSEAFQKWYTTQSFFEFVVVEHWNYQNI